MKRLMTAVALGAGGLGAAVPAQAATFVQDGGAPRGVTISTGGTVGQTFAMIGTSLTSFGFQFQTGLSGTVDGPVTFTLREGGSLTGTILKQVTATPSLAANRSNFWYDFTLGGVALTDGALYTAALTATTNRLSVIYSPAATGTVDGYTKGQLLTANAVFNPTTNCGKGICDANFRFDSTGATGAVPEPATWALLMLGFGAVGYTLRRARGSRVARQRV
ncbi:hypothetical protein J2Y58_004090 [Sphingomonas sp. BE138]|uniref:PEPxxWA-CTERM sorting domain-containing protein n=1 Tax=Sphingomonas sp. BE138 TaxID=2817845 RepID=UPI00285BDFBE|nr:PEPxxWA-CTERM sorting domain-containing protein [Sphingomonas sp. BE138]MDR6790707.1 hypothetical protein [Sphingomonas sp. BE138]